MLPVLMIVGGLLALWIQSQPTSEGQTLPNSLLRSVGGMLVIGGVLAFFSQTLAWLLVGAALVLGIFIAQKK